MSANPFLDPLLDRCRAHPEALFGVFRENEAWRPVSLAAMLRRASCFAALFVAQGVPAGGTVLLILRHGFDAHAAFIGAMLAGAVPSFLPYPNARQDHTLYWTQHHTVLGFCRPHMVLVYDELHAAMVDCAEGSGARIVAVSAVEAQPPAPVPRPLPGAEAIGRLISEARLRHSWKTPWFTAPSPR